MTTRVLLITVGGSPQIVTETVHALITASEPWVPDRILLATTAHADQEFREGNPERGQPPLVGSSGRLAALYAEVGLTNRFVEPEILVARLPSGDLINDIRSEDQIAAFAELLLVTIGAITDDHDTELHVSLAGGRKTMSFIAGQVMSLYGRASDTLSHVLVEPSTYESLETFWWPGQVDPVMRGKVELDPSAVSVELHSVPFVRVKAYLDANDIFDHAPTGYAGAVARANEALAVNRLVIDLPRRLVTVGHFQLFLHPRNLATLGLIVCARRSKKALKIVGRGDDRKISLDGDVEAGLTAWAWLIAAMDIEAIYDGHAEMAAASAMRFDAEVARLARSFVYEIDFGPPLSRLRKQLRETFPRNLFNRVLVPPSTLSIGFEPSDLVIIVPSALADHPGRPI